MKWGSEPAWVEPPSRRRRAHIHINNLLTIYGADGEAPFFFSGGEEPLFFFRFFFFS